MFKKVQRCCRAGAEQVQSRWCMDQSRNIAGGAEVVVHGSE